mmetsp:Transcript_34511/g.63195  ORF Transcript_34511/g.63195 Transcript_34511/m.63195 type:complete len:119 (+) Transcript_34511:876-1232(+)
MGWRGQLSGENSGSIRKDSLDSSVDPLTASYTSASEALLSVSELESLELPDSPELLEDTEEVENGEDEEEASILITSSAAELLESGVKVPLVLSSRKKSSSKSEVSESSGSGSELLSG